MLINKDYMTILRTGIKIDRDLHVKHRESAWILGWCLILPFVLAAFGLIFGK